MKGTFAVKTYIRDIKDLGEFRFIFTNNTVCPNQTKYYAEINWVLKYFSDGLNFELGYPVEDIDKEIEKLETEEGFKEVIRGAKTTCEVKVMENASISLGAYIDILKDYFKYTDAQIYYLYTEGIVDEMFSEDEMDELFDTFEKVEKFELSKNDKNHIIDENDNMKIHNFLLNKIENEEVKDKLSDLDFYGCDILVNKIYGYLEQVEKDNKYCESYEKR